MLSRFHLIPERYGRTDGRTDRFAISISRVSMLTRGKNSRVRRMLKPTVQQYQQCCHLANGNKTCCSLLLFKNNNVARGSQGFVRQSSRNVLRVEQPSVLNKFFSELQYVHSLTHCCAWPAEGRSVLHIERSWPAIQAAPICPPRVKLSLTRAGE